MKLICKKCGAKVDTKEIETRHGICPICKEETNWVTDPELFINDL